MKTNHVLLVILITLFPFCNFAQEYPSGSLLWKISGNELTHDSYVFGTWHGTSNICADYLDSIPHLYETFNMSSQYVGENNGNASVEAMGDFLLPHNITYADLLNKEDIAFLDSILMLHIQTTSSTVRLAPNHVYVMLLQLTLKDHKTDCAVIDSYLMKMASDKEYTIDGLDDAEINKLLIQGVYFQGKEIPQCYQKSAQLMISSLREMPNTEIKMPAEMEELTRKLENAYMKKDLNLLMDVKQKQFNFNKQSENISNAFPLEGGDYIITERNRVWMKKIPELIKKEPTFIAVGALHLSGEAGLLHQLRLMGYTVEAIN